MPIRLGLLLGISRGGATGFSLIYIENEWLGNSHSFMKISGGRSMILFLLAISCGEFCEPNRFRGEQLVKKNVLVHSFKYSNQDIQEETKGVFFWHLLFSEGCLLFLVGFKILFFWYCLPKSAGLEGLPNLLLLELEGLAERILILMCFLCYNLA